MSNFADNNSAKKYEQFEGESSDENDGQRDDDEDYRGAEQGDDQSEISRRPMHRRSRGVVTSGAHAQRMSLAECWETDGVLAEFLEQVFQTASVQAEQGNRRINADDIKYGLDTQKGHL